MSLTTLIALIFFLLQKYLFYLQRTSYLKEKDKVICLKTKIVSHIFHYMDCHIHSNLKANKLLYCYFDLKLLRQQLFNAQHIVSSE